MDCLHQKELTSEQKAFFADKGFLVFANALCSQELEDLQRETLEMIENMQNDPQNSDYWYNDEIPAEWYRTFSNSQIKPPSPLGNEVKNEADNVTIKRGVPFRIEFPLEKSKACKRLMGHAFILRAIVQLLATPSFIPTWDSFVFKARNIDYL